MLRSCCDGCKPLRADSTQLLKCGTVVVTYVDHVGIPPMETLGTLLRGPRPYPLKAEEILKHPLFGRTTLDLAPRLKGKVDVAKDRNGPVHIAYEVHGNGPRHLIVGISSLRGHTASNFPHSDALTANPPFLTFFFSFYTSHALFSEPHRLFQASPRGISWSRD